MLEGRVALVTGGGAGIGGAVVEAFVRAGARVCFVEQDAERADACIARVGAADRVRALVADVRERETAEAARAAAEAFAGAPVDVLVNNVGDYRPAGRFVDTTDEQWDALDAVNWRHVLRFTRACLPAMLEGRRGAIVNVATVEAFRGIPANAVYSALKAAVVQFTRSLAVEVGGHGVRVNTVAPDVTQTPQTPYDRWVPSEEMGRVPSWVPLGRFGQPADVADAICFLASDQARFVTGQTLATDGGTLAAGGWYKRSGFDAEPGPERWTNRPRNA